MYAGCQARPVTGYYPEWHTEGVYGSQHVHIPTRVFYEAHWRHFCLYFSGLSLCNDGTQTRDIWRANGANKTVLEVDNAKLGTVYNVMYG